jgi:hypothetical protein
MVNASADVSAIGASQNDRRLSMNPNHHHPEPQSLQDRLRAQANVMAGIASAGATFAEVLMFRKNFGCRYFQGLRSFWAFLLVPAFSLFWQGYDLRLLYGVWLLFIVRCAYHKRAARRRETRSLRDGSPLAHSMYNGACVLAPRFPRLGEIEIKRKVEPVVMMLMGLSALIISAPVGWLFIWCAVAMYVHTSLIDQYDRQRTLDVLDAAWDSEQIAARVRDRRRSAAGHFRSRS